MEKVESRADKCGKRCGDKEKRGEIEKGAEGEGREGMEWNGGWGEREREEIEGGHREMEERKCRER